MKELNKDCEKKLNDLLDIAEITLNEQRAMEHGLDKYCEMRGMTRTELHNVAYVVEAYHRQGYDTEALQYRISDIYPRWVEAYESKTPTQSDFYKMRFSKVD